MIPVFEAGTSELREVVFGTVGSVGVFFFEQPTTTSVRATMESSRTGRRGGSG